MSYIIYLRYCIDLGLYYSIFESINKYLNDFSLSLGVKKKKKKFLLASLSKI